MVVVLVIACVIAFIVFRLGVAADWHWGAALVAAFVPIAFTLIGGILGLFISIAFAAAIYKAT